MVRIGQQLAKNGQPGYQARLDQLKQNADQEVALAALYALRNIGDDEALS